MPTRTQKWIINLVDGLEKNVDNQVTTKVLENCGRNCQSQSFVRKAKKIYEKSEDTKDFLKNLSRVYKNLHVEGDKVYIIYPKCYCTQVNKIPKGTLSTTYCNCSKGWAKALFEGATGKPVEVIKEKTIISGDDHCRFRIIL